MVRTALILLLCVGLLLPKATATLAVLLPGSFSTIVICTGTEVVAISLDARGQPVGNTEIQDLDCLSEANPIADVQIDPQWQILHRHYNRRFSMREAVTFSPSPEDRPSLGRAPPARTILSHFSSLA